MCIDVFMDQDSFKRHIKSLECTLRLDPGFIKTPGIRRQILFVWVPGSLGILGPPECWILFQTYNLRENVVHKDTVEFK